MIQIEKSATNYPLTLTISENGVGGVTGLSATVAIRNAATTNSYMDWADGLFKTTGWTTKNGPMTDLGTGVYIRNLSISATASLLVGLVLAAEYIAPANGIDTELLEIVTEQADVTLVRKNLKNKFSFVAGNPGTMTLYDDDGVTPILTWAVRDHNNGAVTSADGDPSLRGAAT